MTRDARWETCDYRTLCRYAQVRGALRNEVELTFMHIPVRMRRSSPSLTVTFPSAGLDAWSVLQGFG